MREQPTIKAYRIVPVYAYPFKEYRYNGSQPLSAEPKKTRESASMCIADGCERSAHARGVCDTHYYRLYRRTGLTERRPDVPSGFRPDKCGTPAGHQRHRYYKQDPCQRCKAAKAVDSARRKAEAKAKKEAAA